MVVSFIMCLTISEIEKKHVVQNWERGEEKSCAELSSILRRGEQRECDVSKYNGRQAGFILVL